MARSPPTWRPHRAVCGAGVQESNDARNKSPRHSSRLRHKRAARQDRRCRMSRGCAFNCLRPLIPGCLFHQSACQTVHFGLFGSKRQGEVDDLEVLGLAQHADMGERRQGRSKDAGALMTRISRWSLRFSFSKTVGMSGPGPVFARARSQARMACWPQRTGRRAAYRHTGRSDACRRWHRRPCRATQVRCTYRAAPGR